MCFFSDEQFVFSLFVVRNKPETFLLNVSSCESSPDQTNKPWYIWYLWKVLLKSFCVAVCLFWGLDVVFAACLLLIAQRGEHGDTFGKNPENRNKHWFELNT